MPLDTSINDVVSLSVHFFNVFDCSIGALLSAMFKKKNSLYLEITNRPSTYAKVLCEHGWTSQVFFCRTGQLRVTSKIVQLVVTDRENVCTRRLRAAILQDFGLKCCVRLAKPWDCIVWNNKWSRHTWVEYHIKDGYFHCDGRQKIATITITTEKKDISASCL